MNTANFLPVKYPLIIAISITSLSISGITSAQESSSETVSGSASVSQEGSSGILIYEPSYFARFVPRNALDMLERVPGFSIEGGDQGRGLGQANTNVLVNGQRLSSKSQGIFDQLRRVPTDNVDRIEIVDGATLELPGLSGQVANVITHYGDTSGRYEYRTIHRPKYAEPSWFGGELSMTGSSSQFEWDAAYTHGAGRGGAGGIGYISDEFDAITEQRDIHLHFEGDFPSLSGSLKWNGPEDTVANLNVQYSRGFTDFSNDEQRSPTVGINQFRDFDNRSRGKGYEIGGDIEFGFGPGTLKLIGLNSSDENDVQQKLALIFEDNTSTTGNRFTSQSEVEESIGRAEYSWDMLGGNWQLDAEAAFNSLDQASQFFNLDNTGSYIAVPLPNSTGEVTEDRYEVILSNNYTLASGLSMQFGLGAEQSELAQTGPGGLTRDFWRPKGSLSLAWTPQAGLDLSLNVSRKVGQLSFGQFLAEVFLESGNANAGNVQLKPTLSWESDLQIKKDMGKWGSTNLRLYARWYEDYIDIIPQQNGGESPGNIDNAEVYGIDWNSTINFDPAGWEGARLDFNITIEESDIKDPLTGRSRPFSGHYDKVASINFRHDIVGSNWAYGIGIDYNHVLPSYRQSQVSLDYEGPIYSLAFVEHKDVFGMTLNFQVFNLTDGRAYYSRTVYNDLRNNSSVNFNEIRDLSVQPIFRLQLKGSF